MRQQRLKQHDRRTDQFIQIEDRVRERLLLRNVHQLVDQRRATLSDLPDRVEIIALAGPILARHQRKIGIAEDRGQHIRYVVRHTQRHLAQRFQSLNPVHA